VDAVQARQIRSERLIAVGRAVLAASSLLAIWLDPSEPARYAETTYSLLVGYLVYALLLISWAAIADLFSRQLGLATHLVDLAIFSILLYLTEGSASPLFVYFVFSLLAAALRWRWPGVLCTALATLAIYIGLSLYAERVLHDPAFELNRFIIRCVYLAVVALLVGYLSAYEQALRRELVRLAAWPRRVPEGARIQEVLQHAASILAADRVLMIWDEAEEPWRYRATLAHGTFDCVREPGVPAAPLVAEPLATRDFLCLNPGAQSPAVLYAGPGGVGRWRGAPLAAELQIRLGCRSVLSVRLEGEGFQGRLFILDKPGMSADDLALGKIIARQITADLDQFYVQQQLQRAAVSEERVRFARELHDGVLQSLTGLALQLKAVRRLLETNQTARGTARARIAEIENLVGAEQRDLRHFVRQLKPSPLSRTEVNAALISHLGELGERIERQWGLRLELTVEPLSRQLSETLAHAVYRLLQETLANAARHGGAKLARVRLAIQGDRLRLEIADDGRGFDFRGRYDLAALNRLRIGPESVKQRVASLSGELVIVSDASGARLEIELPLRPTSEATVTPAPADPASSAPRMGGTG
jgi:signal transduction histidine kinase